MGLNQCYGCFYYSWVYGDMGCADGTRMTIDCAFADFLRLSTADGAASARTIKSYREHLACFVGGAKSAGVEPAAASRRDMEEYRAWLIAKAYSRATIKSRLSGARVLFNALNHAGLRSDNPAARLRPPRATASELEAVLGKALSPDEAGKLLSHLDGLRGY